MFQMCFCLLAEIFICPNFSESYGYCCGFFCKQKESSLPLSFLAWQLVWSAWNNCYAELAFTFQPISLSPLPISCAGGIATTCHHMLHPKKTTTIYNSNKSSLAVMCCTAAALIQTHSFPIHFLYIQMVVGCSTNSSLLTAVVVTAHNTEQEEFLLHELVGWCCWWWWYYQRLLESWTGVLKKVNNYNYDNPKCEIHQWRIYPSTNWEQISHCTCLIWISKN